MIKYIALIIIFGANIANAKELYKDNSTFARHIFDIETGSVHQSTNKIGSGTGSQKIDLLSLQNQSQSYSRFSYYFNMDRKNSIRFLIAPFNSSGSGYLPQSTEYKGQMFNAIDPLYYSYKFNSYRLTYRRNVFESSDLLIRIGITGKIRDAHVKLFQGETSSINTNIGFVPLLHFNIEYKPFDKFKFIFEGDFAGSKYGRAIDVSLSGKYDIQKNINLSCGYRILEGGVMMKDNYNRVLINYYFLGFGFNI
jgi:hypothetical protein